MEAGDFFHLKNIDNGFTCLAGTSISYHVPNQPAGTEHSQSELFFADLIRTINSASLGNAPRLVPTGEHKDEAVT